jgi:hypothetical protein
MVIYDKKDWWEMMGAVIGIWGKGHYGRKRELWGKCRGKLLGNTERDGGKRW